jgi:uncharacterized protein (DUF2344 family)
MLSESTAEVARFFNKTINLDIIDKVLGKAETKRRSTNQEIERNKKQIVQLHEEIESLNWIDDAETLINQAEFLDKKIKDDTFTYDALGDLLEKAEYQNKILHDLPRNIDKISSLVDDAMSFDVDISHNEQKRQDLYSLLSSSTVFSYVVKKYKNVAIDKIEHDIQSANICNEYITRTKESKKQLKNLMDMITGYESRIKLYTEEIKQLEEERGNVCPTCGRPF